MKTQQAQPQQSGIFGRTMHDARRIGFLAVTLFSMLALSGLHVTPSLAAPRDGTTQGGGSKTDERLAALEAAVASLQTTVNTQNTQITSQAGEIAVLKKADAQQAAQITALQTTTAAQATQIATLETKVDA